MEVSSRQIVALAAPVVVIYLTWSAVSGTSTPAAQTDPASSISTVAVSKRPVIAKLSRDVFSQEGYGVTAGGTMSAPGQPGANNGVHLNGTVVAGKWRMAIIDGTRVFEGQTFRGFQVKTVARDSVTLVNAEGQPTVLSLDIAEPPALAALAKAKPGEPGKPGATEAVEKPAPPAREHETKPAARASLQGAEKPTIVQPAQAKQGNAR